MTNNKIYIYFLKLKNFNNEYLIKIGTTNNIDKKIMEYSGCDKLSIDPKYFQKWKFIEIKYIYKYNNDCVNIENIIKKKYNENNFPLYVEDNDYYYITNNKLQEKIFLECTNGNENLNKNYEYNKRYIYKIYDKN